MTLKEQLDRSMKMFMQRGLKTETMAIRMAKAAITNQEKTKGATGELTDVQVVSILKRQIKEHKDSLSYLKEDKQEEITKFNTYIFVLNSFLPEEMPESEARDIITKLLLENNITAKSQMGPAMQLAKPALEGKIDNSKISQIVRDILI